MIAGAVARLRSLWRGVHGGTRIDAEMAEEFRVHQEMRAADLERAGLSPGEARRRARLEFGSTERYREEGRRSRGLRPFDELRVSWLDVKLGFRMLVRYPGLTFVGGLAFAFAIWLGAGAFELVSGVIHPRLPLPAGDRIVGLQNWDASAGRPERQAMHDLVRWRAELSTVRELGAFRTVERNLVTGEGGEPVEVAEISASAFRLAGVPPLLGRPLIEADEHPGATPVVVVGHGVWQRRFAGDSSIVGRVVRLGRAEHVVVGVMPESFAFPVSHEMWTPLSLDAAGIGPREGPGIQLFGRLAPGASLDAAQAELTAAGQRAAEAFPETHAHLRPQVMPFAKSILNVSRTEAAFVVLSGNVPLILLLALVCGNVGLLTFARAATREAELVVRTALGANRGRLVMQLFAEALVLGTVAAAVGLAAAGFGLRWVMGVVEVEILNGARLPFWFDDRLSPVTIAYTALLTLAGAAIAGVLPALRATRGMSGRLKQVTAGGGGMRLGGVWTVVIVAQVAVTVAFPAVAYFLRRDVRVIESTELGFPDEQFLSARLEMDREAPPGAAADTSRAAFLARFERTYRALEERLERDPRVVSVTYGDRLPRTYHPHRLVEVDSGGAAPLRPEWPAYRVSSASVDLDFFRVVDAPVLAGRGFVWGDLTAGELPLGVAGAEEGVVIVNESFVRLVLGGRNPIGRRLRYVLFEERSPRQVEDVESAPWYRIVGVVRDLGMAVGADVAQGEGGDPKVAGIYHPAQPARAYPLQVAVEVRGDPATFAPRLRQLAARTDPTLRLYDVAPLDRANDSELRFLEFWFHLVLVVSTVAVVLSLAGIYSVMSFTVARRRREIGIRVALGASRARVLRVVFRRPLAQVALGVAAGVALTSLLAVAIGGGAVSARGVALVLAYAALMLSVCLLACIVPTRRALGVEPTEALRADG